MEEPSQLDFADPDIVVIDEVVDVASEDNEDDSSSFVEEVSWEICANGTEEEIPEETNTNLPETKLSTEDIKTPHYDAGFTGYLTEKEFCMETGKHVKNDCLPKKTCFNCLGDHNIMECTEKKDFNAIARNKRSILGKRTVNIRFYEDVDNKFSSHRPGVISTNLRQALGLMEYEAPDFIYRMRYLGYPPGWLKDAEVKRSDVSLFDGSGKPHLHPEEEEGETDVALTKYQPDKLINFPGFNVSFPSHIQEQSKELNYPRMKPNHSKESFLNYMRKNSATKYKRKKLKSSDTPRNLDSIKKSGDMDVDDTQSTNSPIEFNPPLPEEIKKPPEPPPVKEDGELSEDSNGPTNVTSPSNPTPTPEASPAPGDSTIPDSDYSSSSCDSPLVSEKRKRKKTKENDKDIRKVKKHHRSSSKGFKLGVCIPESITPYKSLPTWSQWSVDVSDHILFDNLPDALGTWQKMKGIVNGVKETMQTLHFEEDE